MIFTIECLHAVTATSLSKANIILCFKYIHSSHCRLPRITSTILWLSVGVSYAVQFRSLLSVMRSFSFLLLGQFLIFAVIYMFDVNLRWNIFGRNSESKRLNPYDARMPILYVAYPVLVWVLSLHLGGKAASESFSRGLPLGYNQQGIFSSVSIALESIKQCFDDLK